METNYPLRSSPPDCQVVIVERNKTRTVLPWWLLMIVVILIVMTTALSVYCYKLQVSTVSGTSVETPEEPIDDTGKETTSEMNICSEDTCVNTEISVKYLRDTDGMIFPNSSYEYLTNDDLAFLTNYDNEWKKIILQMGINELYARHGFRFGRQEILDFYSQYSWYCGTKSMNAARCEFNDMESWNADFLVLWLDSFS